ncbi:MAG: hypothetical protein IJ268_00295, partial [Proteobacteria bacterium]|nr:hypothetical protein [Pseudomonadota bacterium]
MQRQVKKLAFVLAASTFGIPSVSLAQDAQEPANAPADEAASASPQTGNASAEKRTETHKIVKSSEDGNATASGESSAPKAAEAAQAEPAPAKEAAQAEPAPAKEAAQSLPDKLASKRTSQEARKEAMRGLANSYSPEAQPAPSKPAAAQPAEAAVSPRIIPQAPRSSARMPLCEHHGYFRTRLNAFGNYDLSTRGTSPVAAPLDSEDRGASQQENISASDTDVLMGANMRFRYSPTIHITESVRISGTFDIMDNFVLGTTPNGLRTNWGADEFFSFNGAEPVNTDTIGKNAVTVKGLYGEADTIIGTFKAGRVPAHWGLGIIYNDGGVYKRDQQLIEGKGWKCLDCDSSDAVDRVEYRIRDPFFDVLYLDFSWDFVNSGLASYNLQQDSIGQAFDLTDNDDVLQFTLSLFDRPISRQEIDERARALFETRQWTADWGVLFSYRKQDIAVDTDAAKSGITSGDGAAATYDLYNKEATAYIVDLWGRFFVPCPHDITLRLEAEFVGAFGSVTRDTGDEGVSRDILQIGAALEAEVWWKDLIAGAKTGVAWADNMVYSGHPLVEKVNDFKMGSLLRFDPNYMVDEIMFSELMGGINNAWYLNLYGEYKFPITMPQMTMALGARLDLSTAVPIVKEATPGNASWYGFEGDLKLFYDESDRFRFEIGAGIFVPGAAWTNRAKSNYPILPSQSVYEDSTSKDYDPEIAWNV